MDRKIEELAEQLSKIRKMAEQLDDVLSVTIRYSLPNDQIIAEIHVSRRLPGMEFEMDYPCDFYKESVKVGDVTVFHLQEKEEETDD